MKNVISILCACVALTMFSGCNKAESNSEPAKPADAPVVDNTATPEPAKPAEAPVADAAANDGAKIDDSAKQDEDKGEANVDSEKAVVVDGEEQPRQDGAPKGFEIKVKGQKYTAATIIPDTQPDPENPHEVICPDDETCTATVRFLGDPQIPALRVSNVSYIEAESLGDLDGDGSDEISVLTTTTGPIAKWREYLIYSLKTVDGAQNWVEVSPALQTNLTILWSTPYVPVEKADKPGFVKVRHVDCTDPIDVETFKIIEKEVEFSKLKDYVPQDSGRKE